LVWIKQRGQAGANALFDTERGVSLRLATNGTGAQATVSGVTAFNSDGFTSGSDAETNGTGNTYASWTFRKAEKFFDVVTWTGDGSNPRTIAHNLGTTPGCIIVKETNASGSWAVWHRSLSDGYRVILNSTNATTNVSAADWFGTSNSTITSTGFSVGSNLNTSGRTLVAYLFAHDAGGFGDDGLQNVISCGATTTSGDVNLGYEPQFVIFKPTGFASDWYMFDNMRGIPTGGATSYLAPNTSAAETAAGGNLINLLPNGFNLPTFWSGVSAIYIAIRRGPMKTPESGTEVLTQSFTQEQTQTTAWSIPACLRTW
jgi:hypothetical protein